MRKWMIWTAAVAGLLLVGLFVAGLILARRFEPYLREQTVAYLQKRFASEAEFRDLKVRLPLGSPLQMLLNAGKGAHVQVEGKGLLLRYRGRRDIPPMFKMDAFRFTVDLNSLWNGPVRVPNVTLTGMALNIPPKGDRPKLTGNTKENPPEPDKKDDDDSKKPSVIIDEVRADGTQLVILPKSADKAPLIFDIHKLRLYTAGPGVAMGYDAELTNAKPPGLIQSKGTFGPWDADEPSNTALTGDYIFNNADLGVFKGIAGTLSSTGKFKGELSDIDVDGEARVPNFQLTSARNPVPLKTKFHAIVDGTNGNTILDPVEAVLGQTTFVCRGGVVRYQGEKGKTVDLDVKMTAGHIDDLLKLAVKGPKPFLRGGFGLTMKMTLPPGQGEVADRLRVAGVFRLNDAHFTSSTVQDKIDGLSRRAQGKPGDETIDEVPTRLGGRFNLSQGLIDFSELKFSVPGARVELTGKFLFHSETLDFHGKAFLDAKVSQTMKGWKRFALKPVDPFFAKEGAGTRLKIKITGTRDKPSFGLDH